MKKLAVLVGIVIGSIAFISCNELTAIFCAGSNCYAENYNMHTTEKKLINAIRIFKEENPDMIVPYDNWDDYDYGDFYFASFYYKDKDVCISTCVKGGTLQFISVWSVTKETGGLVNQDIKGSENKAVKKEFEQRIVKPLKEILVRK